MLRWREWLLAFSFISLGIAVVAGALISWYWNSPWAATVAILVLWLGMLLPVSRAFSTSRPAGLLGFRPLDLLYGVALGLLLRMTQGALEGAFSGSVALPSYPLLDGRLAAGWWFTDVVAVVAVAPILEEFFFRGVLVVALYTVLRRPFGRLLAAGVSVLVSTGVFVLVHGIALTISIDQAISLSLMALGCAVLVMLTGRIWGAVVLHVVYNATFVALALAGTF